MSGGVVAMSDSSDSEEDTSCTSAGMGNGAEGAASRAVKKFPSKGG